MKWIFSLFKFNIQNVLHSQLQELEIMLWNFTRQKEPNKKTVQVTDH